MGGVTKAFKNLTSAITKPFQQIAKAAAKPIKSAVGSIMPDQQVPTATADTAPAPPAPPAADVNVAATTANTQTEDTTKRAGLMRSAKGKKSLTVSRSSGGGLNV